MIITNNLDMICVSSEKTPVAIITNELDMVNLYSYIWTIGADEAIEEISKFFALNGNNAEDFLRVRASYNETGENEVAFYYLWQLSFYKRTRYSLKGHYNAGFGHNDNYVFNPEHIRMIENAVENTAFFVSGKENMLENFHMVDAFIVWFGDDNYIYDFAVENNIPTLCLKDIKVGASAEMLWEVNCHDGVENEMCRMFNDCRQDWQ